MITCDIGHHLGVAWHTSYNINLSLPFYPAVTLSSYGSSVRLNVGNTPFMYQSSSNIMISLEDAPQISNTYEIPAIHEEKKQEYEIRQQRAMEIMQMSILPDYTIEQVSISLGLCLVYYISYHVLIMPLYWCYHVYVDISCHLFIFLHIS